MGVLLVQPWAAARVGGGAGGRLGRTKERGAGAAWGRGHRRGLLRTLS